VTAFERVVANDIETCPICGGAVRIIIACIENAEVIEKTLTPGCACS
jgi:hypothetical protein